MQHDNPTESISCSKSNWTPAWMVIAAIGATATAFVIARKIKHAKTARFDDLVDLCDRSARALDERLHSDVVYAH